jgi:hypothetical protein
MIKTYFTYKMLRMKKVNKLSKISLLHKIVKDYSNKYQRLKIKRKFLTRIFYKKQIK